MLFIAGEHHKNAFTVWAAEILAKVHCAGSCGHEGAVGVLTFSCCALLYRAYHTLVRGNPIFIEEVFLFFGVVAAGADAREAAARGTTYPYITIAFSSQPVCISK